MAEESCSDTSHPGHPCLGLLLPSCRLRLKSSFSWLPEAASEAPGRFGSGDLPLSGELHSCEMHSIVAHPRGPQAPLCLLLHPKGPPHSTPQPLLTLYLIPCKGHKKFEDHRPGSRAPQGSPPLMSLNFSLPCRKWICQSLPGHRRVAVFQGC